jgi:hypothetical protein
VGTIVGKADEGIGGAARVTGIRDTGQMLERITKRMRHALNGE